MGFKACSSGVVAFKIYLKVIPTKGNTKIIGYVDQYSSLVRVCITMATFFGYLSIISLLAGHKTTAVTITSTYIGGNGNIDEVFFKQLEAIKVKIDVDG